MWASTIQAFGNTEIRFSECKSELKNDLGPGQYKLKNLWKNPKTLVTKGQRNQIKHFKTLTVESSFKSTTNRSIANHIQLDKKKH